jgi:hypothetical protein
MKIIRGNSYAINDHEKRERFHARRLLRNSSALFAFNVCSKTNHRGRLAVAAPGCTRLIRSLSLELETFDGLADGSLCRMLADKFR